jgi:hypothetical protein
LYFRGRRIRIVTKDALDALVTADPYRLHDGELVKSQTQPTVYVVENGALRPIPSGDVFESIGWKWTNVVTVRDRVIAAHEIGLPFDIKPKQTVIAQNAL